MTFHWVPHNLYLTFQFGELSIAQRHLRVLNYAYRLPEIRTASQPPSLLANLPKGIHGYLLRSIPTSVDLSTRPYNSQYFRYQLKSYNHCLVDLTGSFSDYEASFSTKSRYTMKRKLRLFAEYSGGSLSFRQYNSPTDISDFYRLARQVSALTYQELILNAGLPNDNAFLHNLQNLAARDQVRGYILFCGAIPVSYMHCPIDHDIVIYAHLGYDPAYAKWSVGFILHWLVLQSLFMERRFKAFDFTEGESEHKRYFSTHQIPCAHILLLRRTLSLRLLCISHRTCNRLSAWVGVQFNRLGIKQAIIRLLRRYILLKRIGRS